jgi:SAM-dependent methyltransferase
MADGVPVNAPIRAEGATPTEYFDAMWSTGPDPWDHGGRFYEHRKYALTAAMLRTSTYESMFEPGCATGILTQMLEPRARRYVATDRHARAVEVTAARVGSRPGLRVEQGQIPDDWPDEQFEAVVLSEVLYYLDPADVITSLDRAASVTARGAELVAVHYREPVVDHAILGDEVHALIAEHPAWRLEISHVEQLFVLESFMRR